MTKRSTLSLFVAALSRSLTFADSPSHIPRRNLSEPAEEARVSTAVVRFARGQVDASLPLLPLDCRRKMWLFSAFFAMDIREPPVPALPEVAMCLVRP